MKNRFSLYILAIFCIITIFTTNVLATTYLTVEVSYPDANGQYKTAPGATVTINTWRGNIGGGQTNAAGRITLTVDNNQDFNVNAVYDSYTNPPHHYYGSKSFPKGSLTSGSYFGFIKMNKWW